MRLPRLSPWRSVRHGVRAWWDHLGLACATSLVVAFGAAAAAGALAWAGIALWLAVALALALVGGPLYGGACLLAHAAYTGDEPSLAVMLCGARRMYARSVALAAAQLLGASGLMANAVFYAVRGGPIALAAAVVAGYGLLFWCMCSVYSWPLLAALELGVISRASSGRSGGAWSAVRNAFVVALSAPGYTAAVLVVVGCVEAILVATGAGAAILGAGFLALVTTRCTRDQLARFGVIPNDPDPDAGIEEDAWKVTG